MLYSVLFTILSIFLFTKSKTNFATRIIYVSVVSFLFFILTIFIISNNYTGKGITDSSLFLISYGFNGVSKYELMLSILIFIVMSVFTLSIDIYIIFKKSNGGKIILTTSIVFLFFAIYSNQSIRDVFTVLSQNNQKIDLSTYKEFNEYYDDPSIVKIGDSKNLVFIYLEGLERSYFDTEIFPDLLPNLSKIKGDSVDFSNIKAGYGTGHTIGGMVASLCGIVLTPYENNYSVDNRFLPGATCLGDLLKKVGYYNVYIGGASSNFTGKGRFFTEHGFAKVYGKENLINELNDKSYLNTWGLYDDSLFDIAYKKFIDLSKTKDKFTLFMLTLTTHHPRGNVPESCDDIKYQDGSIKMLNAVACSDKLISDFVRKIQNSEYGNNTVIVIATDQEAGLSDAKAKLDKTDRNILYMVLDPNSKARIVNNNGFLLDVGLSTLPFIGFRGNLGLAQDLNVVERPQEVMTELNEKIKKWIPAFSLFWNFPRIENSITLDPVNMKVLVDNDKYDAPIVIKYDKNFNTTLTYSNPYTYEDLSKYTIKKDGRFFLIFDSCSAMTAFEDNLDTLNMDMCMVIGYDNNFILSKKIESKTVLSKEELMPIK